ncbi:MAG: hypothetical protein ACLFTY_02320 [Candidatus Aenigmatarchaeota archaeon]
MAPETLSRNSNVPGLQSIGYFDPILKAEKKGDCERIGSKNDDNKITDIQNTDYSLDEYLEKLSSIRKIEEPEI